MIAMRRKKFALLVVMLLVMSSSIVLTSFYKGSDELTLVNGEPLLIGRPSEANKVDTSPVVEKFDRSPEVEKVDISLTEEKFDTSPIVVNVDKSTLVVNETDVSSITRSIQARMEQRKNILKDKCSEMKVPFYRSLYSREPSKHMMISQKKHLMYCFVPKVASTNFRRVFLGLEGIVSPEKVPFVAGYDVYFTLDKHFQYLATFKAKEQTNMLQSYKKFIVVREPLERLLSGFRNKFFHPNQGHRNVYYTLISRFYDQHPVLKQKRNMTTDAKTKSITFRDFLIFWTDKFETGAHMYMNMNEHFTPTSELCNPCNYHFDYILRYENLDEEAKFMFDELDLGIAFPARNDNYSAVATNTIVDDFYMPVDGWILKKVWTVLQWDFQYFDYKLPDWYLNKIS